nr:MAG TPA: hypothetical protein [Caudoviricetes sp.]
MRLWAKHSKTSFISHCSANRLRPVCGIFLL